MSAKAESTIVAHAESWGKRIAIQLEDFIPTTCLQDCERYHPTVPHSLQVQHISQYHRHKSDLPRSRRVTVGPMKSRITVLNTDSFYEVLSWKLYETVFAVP